MQTRSTPSTEYDLRVAEEKQLYEQCADVHALPGIFHYWSNRYLRPMAEQFGFSHPDAFFTRYLARAGAARSGEARSFFSVGAGNCDTELRIARALIDAGVSDFQIECLELNPAMLERGRELARAEGLAEHVVFVEGDFNRWTPDKEYDAVMANQSLHHVENLEGLFDAVKRSLKREGLFITSDMIGRNGHQRWPEALRIVREFWQELAPRYRYNQQLHRHEEIFQDWDASVEGFEGIRAQEILPLLLSTFRFDLFLGFANVVDPFIDRSFGHHFDASAEEDRAFIDRVHARDEAEIRAGTIKPTHMFAVLRAGGSGSTLCRDHLTPEFCVRQAD